ncbi:MAG TPA: response regulator transcription factor [Rhizobiaceae bacterium]|nr:response regulator transcription factor [Rhizobiaceae bacterium]
MARDGGVYCVMCPDQHLSSTHIVVVDDDMDIRDLIRACIELEGYRVSEAANGTELREILRRETVDLVTLDLKLNNEDGLALAREVQGQYGVPIIMITGKGEPIDRIVGLELGADDYISKPFHVREVLARIRSVLRRHAASMRTDEDRGRRYIFDGWQFDCQRRELTSPAGEKASLTVSESALLEVFLANANRVLTRDEIIELTKGASWFGNDRLVDNQVNRLKRKMARLHAAEGLIQSVRSAGYVFTATVNK